MKSPSHKQSRTWDPDSFIDEHNRHRRLKGMQELKFRRKSSTCPVPNSNGLSVLHRGLAAPLPVPGSPPTPAHTGSVNSDDSSNSPPVWPQSQSFLLPKQDVFEFQHFEASTQHYPIRVKPPAPLLLPQPSISNSNHNYAMSDGNQNNASDRRGSNSSNNDNMTPGSRRKAQNRVAQRAFRGHRNSTLKTSKLRSPPLQKDSDSVFEGNERIKLQLQKITIENTILKERAAHWHRGGSKPLPVALECAIRRHIPTQRCCTRTRTRR